MKWESLAILGIFILLMIYFAVFLEIGIKYNFLHVLYLHLLLMEEIIKMRLQKKSLLLETLFLP